MRSNLNVQQVLLPWFEKVVNVVICAFLCVNLWFRKYILRFSCGVSYVCTQNLMFVLATCLCKHSLNPYPFCFLYFLNQAIPLRGPSQQSMLCWWTWHVTENKTFTQCVTFLFDVILWIPAPYAYCAYIFASKKLTHNISANHQTRCVDPYHKTSFYRLAEIFREYWMSTPLHTIGIKDFFLDHQRSLHKQPSRKMFPFLIVYNLAALTKAKIVWKRRIYVMLSINVCKGPFGRFWCSVSCNVW